MADYNGNPATVWMRSLRPHTYEGRMQDVGSIYLAHEEIVETIEILKMAVRETPPRRAVREPAPAVAPVPPPAAAAPVQPMTTESPLVKPSNRAKRGA